MTTTALKKELHAYIEKLDKQKLEAIYTLVAEPEGKYELTDEQLAMLEKRRKDHLSGKSKSYNLQEVRKHLLATRKK
jgi:hypothetical protein